MPTSIATIQIKAPADEVYRFLVTPHLISEWVSGLRPGKRVGGDSEIKLGLRSIDMPQPAARTLKANPEIVNFMPDNSISMRVESTGFIMHTRFHLFESDGVTTVRQFVKVSYKRWFKLFAKITNRSMQNRISKDLVRLKTRVEQDGRAERSQRSA